MKKKIRQSRSLTRQFALDYLFVSIIPVLMFLFLVAIGSMITGDYLANLIQSATHDLNEDAELHLKHLGQSIIQSKARGVAKQIDIFLKGHPHASIRDLQKNTDFQDVAMQKVGKTGYTCLYEAETGIMRIHPNPRLIDRDMSFLADKLPTWWAIFEPTLGGKEVSGYYDWIEPKGSIRQKYMTMTPVGRKLKGRPLMIAATTYIDEFSAPIAAMKTKADEITSRYQDFVSRQGIVFGGAAIMILLLTFAGVYLLGRRAALRYIRPIERMAKAAREIGKGKWESNGHEKVLQRKDEIGELARAFSSMTTQLRELFDRLEKRVAELKMTQKALKQSEEHYRSLFDGVPIALYRSSPEGKIIDANQTIVQMLGYPDRETFLAQNAAELYADHEDRLKWQEEIGEKESVHSFEVRMRRCDGTVIWIEDNTRPVLDEDGRVLYYEGSLKNITEQKAAKEALLESENRFRKLYEESKRAEEVYSSLINSSADAIVIYDMVGKPTYVSPVFTQLFGWSLEEVKGKQIPFLPDSEREATMAIIKGIVKDGTPCQGFETKRYTKDGRLLDISISSSRYDDHEGDPAGILVILRDISEKKRLEAQLQHAEKMEAIGTLAGGIAHDFNNLMMGIQGNISLILLGIDSSHPDYGRLKRMEKQIKSGSRLTAQLLGYARKGKYEIKSLNLNQVIKENAEAFGRTRKDITVHLKLADGLASIEADMSQIEQVLMNFFVNAADAMPDGGKLEIKTMNVTHEDMVIKPYDPKPGNYVLVEVSDNGIGMDKKTLKHIFEPFFTTKEMGRGTGLGLASAYGIIKGHGGYIDVDSKKGHGTIFSVYLPASDEKTSIASARSRAITRGSGNILFVDDEEIVVNVVVDMLEKLGYEVIRATSGREAINIYKEDFDSIDLVILDMVMPELGGGKTYDLMKEINPEVKVLLSSGYSIDGQAKEILNRGCNGFIQKPFNMEELSRKTREILDEK